MPFFKGFALAFSMLTIVPFFKVHDFFKGINGYAVMNYPLIGLILGGILYGVALLLEPYLPHTQLMLLIFALWVVLTGALHLDGLSDTLDALFVAKSRREAVLKDPHVGAMGMIFSVTFLILKEGALWHLEALLFLPLVLMLSRLNVVIAIYLFDYIRPNGMSTLAKEEFVLWQFLLTVILFGAVALYIQPWLLLIALVVLITVYGLAKKTFGGFSGDLYGFLIEMTELVLLHALLIKGMA